MSPGNGATVEVLLQAAGLTAMPDELEILACDTYASGESLDVLFTLYTDQRHDSHLGISPLL
jgi:hypothetical protein